MSLEAQMRNFLSKKRNKKITQNEREIKRKKRRYKMLLEHLKNGGVIELCYRPRYNCATVDFELLAESPQEFAVIRPYRTLRSRWYRENKRQEKQQT